MSSAGRWLVVFLASTGIALGLAATSVSFHRHVPVVVGNMCPPTAGSPSEFCYRDRLIGGWPFAFLYDNPGTSVLGALGPEDDFRPAWFLADTAVFDALTTAGLVGLRLGRRRLCARSQRSTPCTQRLP
jgi:hypothetical protein